MPIPLLVWGGVALCALFLGGCSSPKKSDTHDEEDSKDAIGETVIVDTPPVEDAIVMCTSFTGAKSVSKLVADSDSEITNGGKVLNNTNIEFKPLFTSCTVTKDKICFPDIENEEWQEYDETHTTEDDKYTLLKDKSFMFCLNGGLVYISEDGQKLKDVEGILKDYILEKKVSLIFEFEWDKQGLPSTSFITSDFLAKAVEIANKLDLPPDDLMALMAFESWFDPAAKNPGSSATGLIQFLENTAKGLGTTTDNLRQMTNVEQIDYVYEYLKPFKGRLDNVGDAYLAVFTGGKGIGEPDDFILYQSGTASYNVNKGLDADNKGYITRGDAIKAVIDRREIFGKKAND